MEKEYINITHFINDDLGNNYEQLKDYVKVYRHPIQQFFTINISLLSFDNINSLYNYLYDKNHIKRQLVDTDAYTVVYFKDIKNNPTIKIKSFTCDEHMNNFIGNLILDNSIEIIATYTTNTETLETVEFIPTKDLTYNI